MNWGENKNCKPDFDDQPSQEHNSARLIQQLPNKPTAGNIKTEFLFSAEYQVLILQSYMHNYNACDLT